MSSPSRPLAPAGQASIEATGIVVLVALLFAALAAWAPGAVVLPAHPPAIFARGVALGFSSLPLSAQSVTNPAIWQFAGAADGNAPIGDFSRATPGFLVSSTQAGGGVMKEAYRAARRAILGNPPRPPDFGPARAAAQLLRNGLGAAAAEVAVHRLAARIARLKELMSVDLGTFVWIKKVGRFLGGGGIDATFTWSDDGCTIVPDFHFTADCGRHDFGYRNAKDLGIFASVKAVADARLARDMATRCRKRRIVAAIGCAGWTGAVWTGVHYLGDTSPPEIARQARRRAVCAGASALMVGWMAC